MNRKIGFWFVLWAVLVVVTGYLAFGYGPGGREYGPRGGWGHMGGWDKGYRSEVAPGWHGMGPGLSGGAAGMTPWLPQNMTEEQSKKASQLLGDAEKTNRSQMQQRWDAQARLKNLYTAEKRDWNAIRSASAALSELQSQELKMAIDMQQKIDGLLSDSQRREISRAWRGYGWQEGQ